MSIKCYKINTDGFYIEDFIVNDYDNLTQDIIIEEIPEGLYMPRWDGETWIEGATQEYIDSLTVQPEKETSTEDYLMDLDYRISKIELGLEEK